MSEFEPIPITLPPGLVRGESNQVAKDRYVDANMVRFWKGKPQRWGGWRSMIDEPVGNAPRGAIAWTALDGARMMAWGTADKLWLLRNGILFDITPTSIEFVEGYVDTQAGVGWNEGGWNEGGWSGEIPIGAQNGGRARTWSLAKWGQDLLANPRGGGVYHWTYTDGTPAVASLIAEAPPSCVAIFVTDDRHLIALGASYGDQPEDQSPLRIAWPNRETLDEWTPDPNNTAGDMLLEQGNEIMGSSSARSGYLILTDTSAHTMTLVGGNDVFGIDRKGSASGLIAPHAIVESNGIVTWMGEDGFYTYDGVIRPLPCDVQDAVFLNINRNQGFKICAGTNTAFREAIWFYPDQTSVENNRYVSVNADGWVTGSLARTFWLDQSAVVKTPTAGDPSGNVLRHDVGDLDENDDPIPYYLETGDVSLRLGSVVAGSENFTRLRHVVPDYERISGQHKLTVTARGRPQDQHRMVKGPYAYDSRKRVFGAKARGRSFSFRISGSGPFRLGDMTAYGRPDGGR